VAIWLDSGSIFSCTAEMVIRMPPASALFVALLFFFGHTARAGSATWNLSPTNGDWNTAANWTPATVPNGPTDVATFQSSNETSITLATSVEVAELVFDAGAASYVITPTPVSNFNVSGTGITNNSGQLQSFIASVDDQGNFSQVRFTSSASAGSNTAFDNMGGGSLNADGDAETAFFDNSTADQATLTNHGGRLFGGFTRFFGSSRAGRSTITNQAAQVSLGGAGHTEFVDNATADRANITNETGHGAGSLLGGGVLFAGTASAGESMIVNNGGDGRFKSGAATGFNENSSAGNATLVANGGSEAGAIISFIDESSASTATLIANGVAPQLGGQIFFQESSTGNRARVELNGTGVLDMSGSQPVLTIGSVEGSGNVHLGSNTLVIGSNDLTTTFSGIIDGAGAVRKVGRGQLTLSGGNTYGGGTVVSDGKLLLQINGNSSQTGTGRVVVTAGVIGGSGLVDGTLTIGNGSGKRATLSPSLKSDGDWARIIRKLAFKSDGDYNWQINSSDLTTGSVWAKSVSISRGAQFLASEIGGATIPLGTVITVIDNLAPTLITGAFSNLPDAGTITLGSNTFQANYEGGDGNDLTLTVIR
jgi:autotransporter-associated beta strand protein